MAPTLTGLDFRLQLNTILAAFDASLQPGSAVAWKPAVALTINTETDIDMGTIANTDTIIIQGGNVFTNRTHIDSFTIQWQHVSTDSSVPDQLWPGPYIGATKFYRSGTILKVETIANGVTVRIGVLQASVGPKGPKGDPGIPGTNAPTQSTVYGPAKAIVKGSSPIKVTPSDTDQTLTVNAPDVVVDKDLKAALGLLFQSNTPYTFLRDGAKPTAVREASIVTGATPPQGVTSNVYVWLRPQQSSCCCQGSGPQ